MLHSPTLLLLHSTLIYDSSTSLYLNIRYSTMAVFHSTWLYITLLCPYFILLYSTSLYHCSPFLCLTLHYSTLALLHSTWLYSTLPRLYFTLLDSTLLYLRSTTFYLTLYYGSSSFCLTQRFSSIDIPFSTWMYISLTWLYFIVLDSTLDLLHSTSLRITL